MINNGEQAYNIETLTLNRFEYHWPNSPTAHIAV